MPCITINFINSIHNRFKCSTDSSQHHTYEHWTSKLIITQLVFTARPQDYGKEKHLHKLADNNIFSRATRICSWVLVLNISWVATLDWVQYSTHEQMWYASITNKLGSCNVYHTNSKKNSKCLHKWKLLITITRYVCLCDLERFS